MDQPPPTPGLARWAWNSLFNRQTPMSKYNAMKTQDQNHQPSRKGAALDEDTQDTFHYKRQQKQQPRNRPRYISKDDTELSRKNVSWRDHNFDHKLRSRSPNLLDPEVSTTKPRSRSRDRDFYRDKELIVDFDHDDYTPHSQRSSHSLRRSRSASYLDEYATAPHTHLPQAYPGRFPSPYVGKDDILSSGTKNLMTAEKNTERNKHLAIDSSSPPIPRTDWRKKLGLTESPLEPEQRTISDPVKSSYQQHYRPRSTMKQPKRSAAPSLFDDVPPPAAPVSAIPSSGSMFRRSKVLDDYSPTMDQNEILRQLDENALDLEKITAHISALKDERASEESSMSSHRGKEMEAKYKKVREELIMELKNSKKLYDSYYRFVGKYKELKTKYELSIKAKEPSSEVRALEKEVLLLRDENAILRDQIKEKDVKLQEDDFTLSDLKSTLQSSSSFEITLRRKIKYMEEKLDREREQHKKSEFDLKEKIYLLEMKAKEDEERLRQAELKIRNLEIENSKADKFSRLDRLSPLKTNTYTSKSRGPRSRPVSMGSFNPGNTFEGFKENSKYAAAFNDEQTNANDDTIDRLIKETL
ncbi:Spindle pole component BBP1 [Cyberlindnera fabianii]|uniref:Spindle pole component BBP1 n=1 Tax=Cyberlindnera fabianii TaxID=36022 RepID=A0A1V2L618_CYBFA|nr:Spindle pole component BBP1 [Cyberlindnera fabianii]